MSRQAYDIAGHRIVVEFAGAYGHAEIIAPTFQPFAVAEDNGREAILLIKADDSYRPDKNDLLKAGDYYSANTEYSMYSRSNGNIVIFFGDREHTPLGIIELDRQLRNAAIALRAPVAKRAAAFSNAVMVAYTFATAMRSTLVAHASVVSHIGSGYMFLGKSGAGKSTHSQLWLDNIPNTELINDDNPIVRIYENGNVRVYGSPWSGKTPCYKQACVPVNAAVSLHKAGSNKVLQLQPVSAFIEILSSVSSLMCYRPCYDGILRTVIKFTESVPVYSLECLPDGSAAELCYETVCRQK